MKESSGKFDYAVPIAQKTKSWGWHALMTGNVWVSLPILTLSGLWAGEIGTNDILIAGILGSILGGLFPWIGGFMGAKFSLPNTILSRGTWGSKGGVISSITTILSGLGWYATHLLLTAIVLIAIFTSILHISPIYAVPIIIGAGLLSLGLGFTGINYISKMAKYFVPILLGLIIIMFIVAMDQVGWTYHNVAPTVTTVSFGQVLNVSFSVFVMSFIFSGDYGRYLKNQKMSFGGAVGPILIQSFFIFVGVMMYVATGSADLVNQLIKMNLIVVAGFIAVAVTVVTNVTNMYVPGLALVTALEGYGKKLHRHIATVSMGIMGLIITLVVYTHLTYFGFLDDFLTYIGAIFACANAVIITDFLLRKRKYSVQDLENNAKGSRYWYNNGYNIIALIAFLAGAIIALMMPQKYIPLFDGFAISSVIYLVGFVISKKLKHTIKLDSTNNINNINSINTQVEPEK